jgi:hypothetical protein
MVQCTIAQQWYTEESTRRIIHRITIVKILQKWIMNGRIMKMNKNIQAAREAPRTQNFCDKT